MQRLANAVPSLNAEFHKRTVSQAGRSLGATAEKAVPFLDADAVRALPSMISRSAPMPVASSSSRRSGIWPTLGYAALAAIVLAIPNKRSGDRSQPADRGRPASGEMGTTRSTDEPRQVPHARAQEPGRGRARGCTVGNGVVFYGLLAIFPAITAVVSLYGLFAKASTINEHPLTCRRSSARWGGRDRSGAGEPTCLEGRRQAGLRLHLRLGGGFVERKCRYESDIDALNVVYDEKEKRGFIKLNLVSLAFTLAALASVLLAVGAVVILPLILGYIGLSGVSSLLLRLLRWPVLLALIIVGLTVSIAMAQAEKSRAGNG